MPATAEALPKDDRRPSDAELMHADGRRVSEADYWAFYYEFRGARYEWNNGRLEEKRLPDNLTFWIYNWLCALLAEFLKVHPVAQYTGLDHGFRFALPDRVVIRKPDLGLVCSDNAVPLGDLDRSYRGTFDLCIESLSDSDRATRERDEVHKRDATRIAAVTKLHALGLDPAQIADTLGIDRALVAAILTLR